MKISTLNPYLSPFSLPPGRKSAESAVVAGQNGRAAVGQHSDHAIVYLPDGRVMALGIRPDSPTVGLSMIELYDPATGTRAIGPSPTHLRTRPESPLLPDGRVIAFGGEYTGNHFSSLVLTNAGTVQNVTQVADLFDPITDSWRPMSDMTRFIHDHNVSRSSRLMEG